MSAALRIVKCLTNITNNQNAFKVIKSFNLNRIVSYEVINKRSIYLSNFVRLADESNDKTESTSQEENRTLTDGEKMIAEKLRNRFPDAKSIDVRDMSGGCGAMYAIFVETIEFKNIRTVKQHQLINELLKNEIKNKMHGLRIYTAVPES